MIMEKEEMKKERRRIGERLMQVRRELGWTREQVAMISGLAEATIQKVEEGVFNVPLDVLSAVADVYGLKVSIRKEAGV